MKRLLVLAFMLLTATPGVARDTFHGALYSFADIYRLTVEGPLAPLPASPSADAPLRVVAAQAAPAPGVQFSISSVREPGRWALLLAGLALAAWVARRRIDAVL